MAGKDTIVDRFVEAWKDAKQLRDVALAGGFEVSHRMSMNTMTALVRAAIEVMTEEEYAAFYDRVHPDKEIDNWRD